MLLQKRIIFGTRGSALALKQTDLAMSAFKAVDPSLHIDVHIIQTHGDINQSPIPLDVIGKGWFTKEIENALFSKEIDLAVHSLKDMADEMPAGLKIGAYLRREDARDVLVTKHNESLEDLRQGAVIGTDSSRRQVQMRLLRRDATLQSLRGNVLTRLEKLSREPYDAIILAAAGLKRLGLEKRITRYFDYDEMTPSPGQGVLALQTRVDDIRLDDVLKAVNDKDATQAAEIERAFSRAMGGGCKSPVGAYAFRDGEEWCLIGMRVEASGRVVREEMRVSRDMSSELGDMLAKKF